MPSYGSARSSLHKMENHNQGRLAGTGSKFSIGNIFGDPFSLATIGIAIASWIIAFASSIIAAIGQEYPNYSWWALAYMFFAIGGITVAIAMDAVYTYHVAIVGFMAAGLVFTTSSVNSLIYWNSPAKEAAAAGFILLSMVSVVWIFYFGSQPDASHRQTIDSFSLHKDRVPSRTSRHMTQQSYRPETTASASQVPHMYNSAQLAGFETSSPVTGDQQKRESTSAFPSVPTQSQVHLPERLQAATQPSQQESAVSEYPYRAKAMHPYEANPDDANEISFNKFEILQVSDVSGRWWQVKRENNETGIAPSNYLILL